ncbi:nicotinate-nucleotide--dimethylbenzimidazole phosphoribosyltransferase [Oceanicella sp. SM1341]|uniref:nicotinate-nucleotide--dimethylbenzimidazole phosphoribosyltransferase n=1 Tax=Oceanicella sp. SM1341 TaxID=1548889 RepID=UPI000E4EE1DC|nr:nicotinate-nucleotide--dimethylbenzimidazole phosphoribosyltransferase [Oceanicella sp. SM1341]
MTFSSAAEFATLVRGAPAFDEAAAAAARARDVTLTKPPGALGRLEELAIWYAGWRGAPLGALERPQVAIFAGNHGITARGVSAFPAEVTAQMVENFRHGGAAINQLSRVAGAVLSVEALELDRPVADFTEGPAMSEPELVAALRAGWEAVDPASDLLVTGEMGIGNTTSAAALAAALWGGDAEGWVGRGTGVDDAGLTRKAAVVRAGLAANPGAPGDPLEALRCLGGREVAAMTGAMARARAQRIPVLLDGFISCAAASVLARLAPGGLDHCLAAHVSAEAGHARLLERLGKPPLLALGLRLGEGSGAALAIGIVRAALACHSGMASFAEAGVSGA